MNFLVNKKIEEIAEEIASSINKKLKEGKKVLWVISGGSAIPVEVLVSKKIRLLGRNRLTIVLGDERYGVAGHPESNWLLLKKAGFGVTWAKVYPVLSGKNFLLTAKHFSEILKEVLNRTDYRIGIFGIGEDGHTSGILPHSEALYINELVCAYESPLRDRITITTKFIKKLDEAFVYAFGENKWKALDDLKKDIPIEEQPAQILKKIPSLTVYTDYNK